MYWIVLELYIIAFYSVWKFQFTPEIEPVCQTDRTITVKRLLILAAFLGIVASMLTDIVTIITFITQEPSIYEFGLLISSVIGLIIWIVFTYITLRFPESMLISHAQIIQAVEVYKSVQTLPIEIVEKDALFSYLKAIPPEIFEG